MRFDEAFGYEQVRVDGYFVNQAFAAGRQGADANHIFVLTGIVQYKMFVFGDFFTVFSD